MEPCDEEITAITSSFCDSQAFDAPLTQLWGEPLIWWSNQIKFVQIKVDSNLGQQTREETQHKSSPVAESKEPTFHCVNFRYALVGSKESRGKDQPQRKLFLFRSSQFFQCFHPALKTWIGFQLSPHWPYGYPSPLGPGLRFQTSTKLEAFPQIVKAQRLIIAHQSGSGSGSRSASTDLRFLTTRAFPDAKATADGYAGRYPQWTLTRLVQESDSKRTRGTPMPAPTSRRATGSLNLLLEEAYHFLLHEFEVFERYPPDTKSDTFRVWKVNLRLMTMEFCSSNLRGKKRKLPHESEIKIESSENAKEAKEIWAGLKFRLSRYVLTEEEKVLQIPPRGRSLPDARFENWQDVELRCTRPLLGSVLVDLLAVHGMVAGLARLVSGYAVGQENLISCALHHLQTGLRVHAFGQDEGWFEFDVTQTQTQIEGDSLFTICQDRHLVYIVAETDLAERPRCFLIDCNETPWSVRESITPSLIQLRNHDIKAVFAHEGSLHLISIPQNEEQMYVYEMSKLDTYDPSTGVWSSRPMEAPDNEFHWYDYSTAIVFQNELWALGIQVDLEKKKPIETPETTVYVPETITRLSTWDWPSLRKISGGKRTNLGRIDFDDAATFVICGQQLFLFGVVREKTEEKENKQNLSQEQSPEQSPAPETKQSQSPSQYKDEIACWIFYNPTQEWRSLLGPNVAFLHGPSIDINLALAFERDNSICLLLRTSTADLTLWAHPVCLGLWGSASSSSPDFLVWDVAPYFWEEGWFPSSHYSRIVSVGLGEGAANLVRKMFNEPRHVFHLPETNPPSE